MKKKTGDILVEGFLYFSDLLTYTSHLPPDANCEVGEEGSNPAREQKTPKGEIEVRTEKNRKGAAKRRQGKKETLF